MANTAAPHPRRRSVPTRLLRVRVAAAAASSSASRVFPIPGSPPIQTTRALPRSLSARARIRYSKLAFSAEQLTRRRLEHSGFGVTHSAQGSKRAPILRPFSAHGRLPNRNVRAQRRPARGASFVRAGADRACKPRPTAVMLIETVEHKAIHGLAQALCSTVSITWRRRSRRGLAVSSSAYIREISGYASRLPSIGRHTPVSGARCPPRAVNYSLNASIHGVLEIGIAASSRYSGPPAGCPSGCLWRPLLRDSVH